MGHGSGVLSECPVLNLCLKRQLNQIKCDPSGLVFLVFTVGFLCEYHGQVIGKKNCRDILLVEQIVYLHKSGLRMCISTSLGWGEVSSSSLVFHCYCIISFVILSVSVFRHNISYLHICYSVMTTVVIVHIIMLHLHMQNCNLYSFLYLFICYGNTL